MNTPKKHTTPKKPNGHLIGMLGAKGESAPLLSVITPTKQTQRIKKITAAKSPISPHHVVSTGDNMMTTTPRRRILRNRAQTVIGGILEGEMSVSLLNPATGQTPPRVSIGKLDSTHISMPEHHPEINQILDFEISYHSIISHPTGRQKPEGPQLFEGSVNQKLAAAGHIDTTDVTWHWCHIIANSLAMHTQKSDNFLAGTSIANAWMLLFESLIPWLLQKLHEKEGPLSNPKLYLDLHWSYMDEKIRLGDKLTYTIKLNAGPKDFSRYVTKVFDMLTQEKIPEEALSETQHILEQTFLVEPEDSFFSRPSLTNLYQLPNLTAETPSSGVSLAPSLDASSSTKHPARLKTQRSLF